MLLGGQTLDENNASFRTTFHKFAAAGDVEAIQSLLKETGVNESDEEKNDGASPPSFDFDMSHPRKKSTALHSALSHNQQGLILDYLLKNGANVNAFNNKGFNPLLLAIIHCRPGTLALEKLLAAGATWDAHISFQWGKFSGRTLLEVAEQSNNEAAVALLKKVIVSSQDTNRYSRNEGVESRGESSLHLSEGGMIKAKKGFDICPICQRMVKFPSKMSFLESDQAHAEQEWSKRTQAGDSYSFNHDEKDKKSVKKIYTSRTYLDQFLSHSNGEAYRKLCSIEYHGLGKNKLRKEISESYSILYAIQDCYEQFIDSQNTHGCVTSDENAINFDNLFVIDLCSGKGVTTAICGALFPIIPGTKCVHNNHFLAVDKLPTHLIPHFLKDENVSYLSRNIMSEDTLHELEQEVHRQTTEEGRTAILVGMHLCGHLSERAIDLFDRISLIRAIILSPCCLPKARSLSFETCLTKHQDGYTAWSHYLKEMMEKTDDDIGRTVRLYNDTNIHSIKNAIIVGTR